MTKQQAKQRIEKLKKLIDRHRYLYHVLDKQSISDAVFDSLKHELYKLEQQNPEFITSDSPTQRVGGEPLKEFKKVAHRVPMLSIEDVFSEKELQDWEEYLKTRARQSRAKGEDETLVSSTAGGIRVIIGHADNLEQAEKLKKMLKEKIGAEIPYISLGPTIICAGAGPGTLFVGWQPI